MEAIDLSTRYMTLELAHPIVPSASPFTETLDGVRAMEDAGAAAIVMHSLFEEQIDRESEQLDHYLSYFDESYAEAQSYFPDTGDYHVGPDAYLEKIRRAKDSVDVPIIGSLNGVTDGGWIDYAAYIEEAGADGLELNLYYIPTQPGVTSAQVEQMYVDVVAAVRERVQIPLAVKLSPFFSAPAHMALRLQQAGADALVLFNRFYQPDFDLESLEVVPNLQLSRSDELRLPLRWIAILHGRVAVDFALTSGVHTHFDVLKGLMAGASVTMMASELLRNGLGRIGEVVLDLYQWMEEHGYASVHQMQGSMSQQHVGDPTAFERANYMKVLQSYRPDPAGHRL